ncbi:hypothetical protein CRENPOLYSF2_1920005 [Crenothrix polyspora]|uniref:Uncharacterized protein n=1 Tax=Crenothrix polyspora TaxID=360316 RepID=A0A1R4H3W1_9GAMM|nr:hypothetical protein CRENPOLYSF2_1920005 [Crenothrix polyspora]
MSELHNATIMQSFSPGEIDYASTDHKKYTGRVIRTVKSDRRIAQKKH